jgi:hypothetical protein
VKSLVIRNKAFFDSSGQRLMVTSLQTPLPEEAAVYTPVHFS